jgi:hypothetical protein
MPKGKPPVHPTEQQLRTALDTLREERDVCRHRLPKLLATGQNTAPLRSEIAACERRMEDITAVLTALATEREREEAAITSADAGRLATDALHRIEAMLAGLQPPQYPTTKGTDQ